MSLIEKLINALTPDGREHIDRHAERREAEIRKLERQKEALLKRRERDQFFGGFGVEKRDR